MQYRICSSCKNSLPVIEFSVDNRGYGDGYRTHCKACRKYAALTYRTRTNYSNAASAKRWRDNPINLSAQKSKEYYAANRDAEYARYTRWRLRNSSKLNARRMEYEARKLSATPEWANQKYIELIYEIARLEQQRTGRKCHVDHIVPLKSKVVCGLHCEANLQILFAEDNASKSNRIWPEAA